MRIIFATVVALAATLSGCSKPAPYWVPGLSLPPGAKIISRQVFKEPFTLAFWTQPKQTLEISFDTAGDWTTTEAYFDRSLAALGYNGAPEQNRLIGQVRGMRPDFNPYQVWQESQRVTARVKAVESSAQSEVAEYGRPGSKYRVLLNDCRGIHHIAISSGTPVPAIYQGKYLLVVEDAR